MLIAIFYSCGKNNCSAKITQFTEKSIKPIIWGCDIITAKTKVTNFTNESKPIHPLDIGRYLFFTTYKYDKTKDIESKQLALQYLSLIDKLVVDTTYYSNNTFKYNFQHDELAPGWWSGMANASIMLGLTYADSVFNQNHTDIINALFDNLSTETSLGGSYHTINETSGWIYEYAWPNMKMENTKAVLNGFIFTLTCLKNTNLILKDNRIEALYKKGLNGLKSKINSYQFKNVDWTMYSHKPVVESTHYAVFVIALLESIGEFESEDWLIKILQQRRSNLNKAYGLSTVFSSNAHKFLFSNVGAPSPYWIDTHPTKLELIFENDTTIYYSEAPKNFNIPIKDRAFISFQLNKKQFDELISIDVYAVFKGNEVKLFSTCKEELIQTSELNASRLPFYTLIGYDCEKIKGNKFLLNIENVFDSSKNDYRNNIGQIHFELENELLLNEHNNVVLYVSSSCPIKAHKVQFTDTSGLVSQRYYQPIDSGKNIIVVNPVGFLNYDKRKPITRITWQIYTSVMEHDAKINVDSIHLTRNNFQLRSVFTDSTYLFAEKKVRGNIY